MEQAAIQQTIASVSERLTRGGYAKSTINHFKNTANHLVEYMKSADIEAYTTEVGIRFLEARYGFDVNVVPSHNEASKLRHLRKLSEYQLHGTIVMKRISGYDIPKGFSEETSAFLSYRRFEGIVEKNIGTISLYLERYFEYLTSQKVMQIPQVTGRHIHGFLRFITGFSDATKDHMMRTVRQFMLFCYKNGYHNQDLSSYAPIVRYEKRARLPSAYSLDEVTKLLESVDRSNPIGKRDYAIVLLIARLGLRSGDVVNLKFENINWEENRISITQQKTGRPLTLPLLEDVGLAIIDYLKFGRPKCEYQNIFVVHKPPETPCTVGGMYTLVSNRISRAGLLTGERKRGPHALRHSLASRLLEENIPLPIISEILGHASSNTTATYLSIDINKLRQCALEVW
jgi:integrase